MPDPENIHIGRGKITFGSEAREVTAYRVKAGRMRAVLNIRSYLGTSEAFITREEARALGKQLTQWVKEADREDRWQRFKAAFRLRL